MISVPKGSYTPAFEINRVHVDDSRGDAPGIDDAQAAAAAVLESPRDGAAQRPAGANRLAPMVDRRRGARPHRRDRVDGWGPPRQRPVRASDASAVGDVVSGSRRGSFPVSGRELRGIFVAGLTGVNSYIWVKAVDGDGLRRLTNTHWRVGKVSGVVTRWPLYRLLANVERPFPRVHGLGAGWTGTDDCGEGGRPHWLPDSRSLVMTGAYVRRPPRPRPPGPGDWRTPHVDRSPRWICRRSSEGIAGRQDPGLRTIRLRPVGAVRHADERRRTDADWRLEQRVPGQVCRGPLMAARSSSRDQR